VSRQTDNAAVAGSEGGFTLAAFVGLSLLYVPTFCKLFSFGWKNADYSHGFLVLAAFLWLLWRQRGFLKLAPEESLRPVSVLLFVIGMFLHAVGAMHGSMLVESLSMVPAFLGLTGFLLGKEGEKQVLFPSLFLLFLVPPPTAFTDMLTSPLKTTVAAVSASLLKFAGYAVARNGSSILIEDYSIVVGDPCSGMRSLIALMAVGAMYAYLQNNSTRRKIFLFISIIPIAIVANIIRLVLLSLITYHVGEGAAEGFLHNFSGFLLFVVSMSSLVVIDGVLDRRKKHERQVRGHES
jgi:exosortase